MTIAMIDEGGEFVVEQVCLCRETGKRLADMGFTRGACGRIVRRGLLGGPLQVRLGDCDIMIRASEASGVEVEAVEGSCFGRRGRRGLGSGRGAGGGRGGRGGPGRGAGNRGAGNPGAR